MMKNLNQLMKQAQEMQGKMTRIQEELEKSTVEGSAGGGLVKMTLTGKGHMKNISIDPSLMNPEEVDMLEDLIVAAFHDTILKVQEKTEEEMGKITGGLNLPAGMKLPF